MANEYWMASSISKFCLEAISMAFTSSAIVVGYVWRPLYAKRLKRNEAS
jgi:hypothetical protein